jgi:PilZ domain-containing protein
MKLSAEQFAELASSFGARESARKHDQRRSVRMELHARVKITPTDAAGPRKTIEVAVCDFSARGISFLNEAPMHAGQQFILQLPRKAGGSVWFLCTTMHCRMVNESLFRVGSEFTCTVQPPPASDDAEAQIERIRQSMLS